MSMHPGKPTDDEQDAAAEAFYGDHPPDDRRQRAREAAETLGLRLDNERPWADYLEIVSIITGALLAFADAETERALDQLQANLNPQDFQEALAEPRK